MTTFYHRTTRDAAAQIIAGGFRDATMTPERFSGGVWISVEPLDDNEGARGDTLLVIDTTKPEEFFADYEWIEDGKPYREWLVPAAVLNRHCTVKKKARNE